MICHLLPVKQTAAGLARLWQNYLGTIAANRQITAEQVFPGAQGMLAGLRKAG
jgi:protease-4